MGEFIRGICSPTIILSSALMAAAIIGLAKSWKNFKDKAAEKASHTESEKPSDQSASS